MSSVPVANNNVPNPSASQSASPLPGGANYTNGANPGSGIPSWFGKAPPPVAQPVTAPVQAPPPEPNFAGGNKPLSQYSLAELSQMQQGHFYGNSRPNYSASDNQAMQQRSRELYAKTLRTYVPPKVVAPVVPYRAAGPTAGPNGQNFTNGANGGGTAPAWFQPKPNPLLGR